MRTHLRITLLVIALALYAIASRVIVTGRWAFAVGAVAGSLLVIAALLPYLLRNNKKA